MKKMLKIFVGMVLFVPLFAFAQDDFVPSTYTADNGVRMGETIKAPLQPRAINLGYQGLVLDGYVWRSPHIDNARYSARASEFVRRLVAGEPLHGFTVYQPYQVVDWEENNAADNSVLRFGGVLSFGKASFQKPPRLKLEEILQILTSNDSGRVFNDVNVLAPNRYSDRYTGVIYNTDGTVKQVLRGNAGSIPVHALFFSGPAKGFRVEDSVTREKTTEYFRRNPGTRYEVVFTVGGANVRTGVVFAPPSPVRIMSVRREGGNVRIIAQDTADNLPLRLQKWTARTGWQAVTPLSQDGNSFLVPKVKSMEWFRAVR